MAGIEIREYCGDVEDLLELTRRAWFAAYAGKMWFSLPDAATMRSWAQDGWCLTACQGTKVVGSIFSIPHRFRINSSVVSIPLITGFSVDPDHRRAALPLVERLRRFHQERGIAFGIGGYPGDRRSVSHRFWTRYVNAFPQKLQLLFRTGHWFKILKPRAFARAGITAWERAGSSTIGHLTNLTPARRDPHVRPYRAGDLDRCAQMLEKASAGLDWAMLWSSKQLANDLQNTGHEMLVFERDGSVQGMVRCRRVLAYGQQPVPAAVIELWADDGLSGAQRVRLLGHLCTHLRERDVHVVQALRSAMMPASAFVANLFLPIAQVQVVALLSGPQRAPAPPKNWSLVLT